MFVVDEGVLGQIQSQEKLSGTSLTAGERLVASIIGLANQKRFEVSKTPGIQGCPSHLVLSGV